MGITAPKLSTRKSGRVVDQLNLRKNSSEIGVCTQDTETTAAIESRLPVLSNVEKAKYNYLERSKLEYYDLWGLGDSFEEYSGYASMDDFKRYCFAAARVIPTAKLFERENEVPVSLASLEEMAAGLSRHQMSRNLAAAIIEAIADGQRPSNLRVLAEAAGRLEMNGEDEYTEVSQGVVDAQSPASIVDKEVAEVILRAVVDYGRSGHWPPDILSDSSPAMSTDDTDREGYIVIRPLPSYLFGVALSVYLTDNTPDETSATLEV